MKSITVYISTFLLAIFAFALVPKELLHDCHVHHEDIASTDQFINGHDCAICDYQLASYSEPQQVQIPKKEEKPKKVIIILVKPKVEQPKIDTSATRGPPRA